MKNFNTEPGAAAGVAAVAARGLGFADAGLVNHALEGWARQDDLRLIDQLRANGGSVLGASGVEAPEQL